LISTIQYIRKEATGAAVANGVVNALVAWTINRDMALVPFAVGIVDIALTSVIVSFLVALFAAHGLRRKFRAGQLTTEGGPVRMGRLPRHLPSRAPLLGLALGASAALIVAVAFGILNALGVAGLSFRAYLAFKAVYCGCLGFVAARWAMLRQLTETPPPRPLLRPWSPG
jgi:hypothetical protein